MLVVSSISVVERVMLVVLQLTTTGRLVLAESESDLEGCGGPLESTQGVIRSPNFPNFYNMTKICDWRIASNSADANISLRLLRFDLQPTHDRIMLYDSIIPGNKEPITIEANSKQRLFVVGSEVSVVLVPSSSPNATGRRRLLAWYSSTRDNEAPVEETIYDCGNDFTESGDVVAPGFPLSTSESAICAWTLRAMPIGRVPRLEVISSNLSAASGERLLIYSPSPLSGGNNVSRHVISEDSVDRQEYVIDAKSAVVVFLAEREKRRNKREGSNSQNGGSIHVRFSSVTLPPPTVTAEEMNRTFLVAVCLLVAAFAIGTTVTWLLCRRRYRRFASGVDSKSKEQAQTAAVGNAAATSDLADSGWPSGADDISSIALTEGFVFGGIVRPSVLLLGVLDTRHRAGVARSLANILSTLGGCDVHDTLLVQADGGLRPDSREGDAERGGCGVRLLRERLLAADRVVVLASAGVRLIAEAARSGRVYARCFRSAAAYFSVSDALGLCGRYPKLRKRTLLVTCCDDDERVLNDCLHSDDDVSWLLKEFGVEDIDTTEPSTTNVGNVPNAVVACAAVAEPVAAGLPLFRLVDDLQRLVGAIHGVAEQERLVWSCAEEFQACGEARKLERHVAAVRRCASEVPQLFLATCGPVVDCEEVLQGRSAALPLSICESRSVQHDQLTDVISVLSIVPPSIGKDDRDDDIAKFSFLRSNAIDELASTTEMHSQCRQNSVCYPFDDVASVISIPTSGDGSANAGGNSSDCWDGRGRLIDPYDHAHLPIDYVRWPTADQS